MTGPPAITLYELRQVGGVIHGECIECGRGRDIPATDHALACLSGDIEVRAIGYRMRCNDCKGRRILTTVAEGRAGP